MTACVNRKHTKKVAAVVTASLVGALSLGVAPVAAMATEGIELQAYDESNVDGATPEYESAQTTFYYNGKGQGRVPSKVTDDADVEHKVYLRDDSALTDGDFYYYYVQIGAGSTVSSNGVTVQRYDDGQLVNLVGTSVKANGKYAMPSAKGNYAVVIAQWKGGDWYLRGIADTFSIVGFSLDDAVLVDGKDATDTTFEFSPEAGKNNGAAWAARLGVAVEGHILDAGDDYTMTIVDKTTGADMSGTALTPGVWYQAVIDGDGDYEGHKVIDFQTEKLDLADASVIGKTLLSTGSQKPSDSLTVKDLIQSINGIDNANFSKNAFENNGQEGKFHIELVKTPDGQEYDDSDLARGAYTYRVTVDDDATYVTGTTEFTVLYADLKADIDFAGCGDSTDTGADKVNFLVNLSEDKPTYFDLTHIQVEVNGTKIDNYDTVVYDDEGNVVDLQGKTQLDTPGTYYVETTVGYTDKVTGDYVAGTKVAKVVVSYGVVHANSEIFMTYKGQNVVSTASDTYDGTDKKANMGFTVKADGKTLVQGTDYTVTIEKQATDGKRTAVEEVVDGGVYIITVEGVTFNGSAEFTFIVNAVKPAHIVVDHDIVTGKDAHGCPTGIVSYTGEAIEATFGFYGSKGAEFEGVPADAYVVDSYDLVEYNKTTGAWEVVERDVELKDKGFYQAHIKTADGVVNYDLDGVSEVFEVTDDKVFNDVSNDFWAAEDIYTANKNGWMNGYGYTDFFGPNDNIKRGDVAVVLYKMAGQPEFVDEGKYDETTGFKTGFGDVDGNKYYAEAILWAKDAGIVSGDEGTNCFRPDDTISRQELAKMLSVYAAKCGEDTAVDTDELLGAYEDADTVSEWAEGYVAYLVSEGIMGNESPLRGTDPITRAEVATMVVRLSDVFDFDLIAR